MITITMCHLPAQRQIQHPLRLGCSWGSSHSRHRLPPYLHR
jgi:hypothetical protein